MRRSSVLVLAILCCVAGRFAHARPDVGVVLVVGKAQAKDRAIVASAVRSAARSVGRELVEAPLTESESATIMACLKAPHRWSCVSPVVSPKGITRLIVVHVEPDRSPDGGGALALTEQVLLAGADVTADQRSCQRCLDEALTRAVFDLTRRLLEEAASGTGRTRLRIMSDPPGAWITLDSTNVGLTDYGYATFPGHHVVSLQREGYETETRDVDVAENQEAIVAVKLRLRDRLTPFGVTPSRNAPIAARGFIDHPDFLPALVGGVGVATLATGIGLQVAMGPRAEGREQPEYLVSVPGIVLISGGGLAIGIGAYLWTRKPIQARPAAMPFATVTPGGGIIGWTGQF